MKLHKINYLVLLLVCLLASCSQPHPENAVPQKSVAVVALDLKSIFEKADISEHTIDQQTWIQHPFNNMLKHPEQIGIDWRQKVYFYMDQNAPGVVAVVHDDDLLTTSLQQMGFQVKADEDFHWATGHGVLFGYTDQLLIGTTQYADTKLLQKQIRKQAQQDETNSFSATQHYEKMVAQPQDMAAFFSASILTTWLGKMVTLGPDVQMSLVSGLLTFNFKQDVAQLDLQLYGNNEKGQQELDELKSATTPLTGDFLSIAPDNTAACVAIGAHSKDIIALLNRNRSIGFAITLAAQVVPLGEVLHSIEGEVAAYVTPKTLAPSMLFTAQMKDTQVLMHTLSWTQRMAGFQIQSIQPGHYSVASSMGNWYFGQMGKGLYVTNDNNWISADACQALQPYQQQVNGMFAFAWADAQQWASWHQIPPMFVPVLQQMGQVVLMAPDALNYHMQVHAAQDDQNLLHDLINIF